MRNTAHDDIIREVSGWPGVTIGINDRNGQVFTHGRVELGHLHGSAVAHLPFPRKVRDQLLAEGRVTRHPVMPDSGWSERRIAGPEDTSDVIRLFRLNYDRVHDRAKRPAGSHAAEGKA